MADQETGSTTQATAAEDFQLYANRADLSQTDITNARMVGKGVLALAVTGTTLITGTQTFGTDAEHDMAAIRTAVTAAGAGGTVAFTDNYLIAGSISPDSNANQTWDFSHSGKFTRADEELTTFVSTLTVGSTQVTGVVDTSNFFVGQDILISDGSPLAGSTYDMFTHRITSLTATTIDFTQTTGTEIINGTISTSGHAIDNGSNNGANGLTVINFSLDGNQANYTLAKWESHRGVSTGDFLNMRFLNPLIINEPGDAWVIGGDGTQVINPSCRNIGGNGYHLSGVSGAGIIFDNPVAKDVQTRGGDVDHADGFISYSLSTGPSTFNNIGFNGSDFGGIGGIAGDSNSQSQINGGYMQGVTADFLMQLSSSVALDTVSNIKMSGVDIIGLGVTAGANQNRILIKGNSSTPTSVASIKFTNCNFINCWGDFDAVSDLHLSGNSWKWQGNTDQNAVVTIKNCTKVFFNDDIEGARYGLQLSGTDTDVHDLRGNIYTTERESIRLFDAVDATNVVISTNIHNVDSVIGIDITVAGTGFSLGDVVTFTGGTPTYAASGVVSRVGSSGEIESIRIDYPGQGYATNPTVSVAGGSGATVTTSIPLSSQVFCINALAAWTNLRVKSKMRQSRLASGTIPAIKCITGNTDWIIDAADINTDGTQFAVEFPSGANDNTVRDLITNQATNQVSDSGTGNVQVGVTVVSA